ncbi:MAG: ribonuclease P protein component [Chlamydiales bacterium]|jgi:ribonuclease P protein component
MDSAANPMHTRKRLRFRPAMRVKSGNDFQRAYRQGNRARGATMIVVACPNGLAYSRLGLSVGKRIWKHAVRRNRVRRLFREAFRLGYPDLPAGYDFVLIPAEPKLWPEIQVVQKELIRLADKAARRCVERVRKDAEAAEKRP